MNIPLLLNYNNLIDKAQREINRLRTAENELDAVSALDCALNAAFTVYHLLEWRQNPSGLTTNELEDALKKSGEKPKSAHQLCKEVNKFEMNLLHGIVTNTKHATVSRPIPDIENAPSYKPRCEENIFHIVTEDGKRIVTESGNSVVTSDSKVIVYFGDSIALDILKAAIKEFSPLF